MSDVLSEFARRGMAAQGAVDEILAAHEKGEDVSTPSKNVADFKPRGKPDAAKKGDKPKDEKKTRTRKPRASRAKQPKLEKQKPYLTELPCKLSAADEKKFGDKLASLSLRLERLTTKKQEAAKAANVDIKAVREQIHVVAKDLNAGTTKRRIKVHVEKDYAKGDFMLIREDTGDVVEKRKLTDAERQAGSKDLDVRRSAAAK